MSCAGRFSEYCPVRLQCNHDAQVGDEKIVVGDVVKMDQTVWVKVIEIDVDKQKISLSMKYVDQSSGEDLDPVQVPSQTHKCHYSVLGAHLFFRSLGHRMLYSAQLSVRSKLHDCEAVACCAWPRQGIEF
jgi:polyribonucleotide nucleotidyltransferase